MHRRFLTYVTLASGVLYCAAVPILKFSGRGYREDEAWAVYRSMNNLPQIVALVVPDVKPPLFYFLLSGWIRAFGHHEAITGYLSSLILLLTLAFTYQIGRTLFGRLAGLWSVLLLGLLPLIQQYGHETNTYSLLLMGTTGTSAALLLWLQTRNGRYAVLYVLLGMILVYTHYYGVFVTLAQAGFTLLFVTGKDRMRLRAFSLFAAMGLAFTLGWGLIVLHTLAGYQVGGGGQFIEGGMFVLLEHLYVHFQSRPQGILTLVFLFGLATAYTATHKEQLAHMRRHWQKGFPLVVTALVALIAIGINDQLPTVTARNMIALLPFICVIGAFGLVHTSRRMQAIIVLMLVVAGYTTYWESDDKRNANQIVAFIGDDYRVGDTIFIDVYSRAGQIANTYYARERLHNTARLPADDVYHILRRSELERLAPLYPQTLGPVAQNDEPNTLQAVRQYLADRQRVWHFQLRSQSHSDDVVRTISEEFGMSHRTNLTAEFVGTLWKRIPEGGPDYFFGDRLELLEWELHSGYQMTACDFLHLESWWRRTRSLTTNYSLGVKVVSQADDSVIANTDDRLTSVLSLQWEPERYYIDNSSLQIPCDAPAGQYDILLVVYDSQTPDNALDVTLPDNSDSVGTLAYLTSIQVATAER